MKTAEYIEGPKARNNFEKGMAVLFATPKSVVVKQPAKPSRKKAKPGKG